MSPLLRPELLLGDAATLPSMPADVVLVMDAGHAAGRGRRRPAPFRKVIERRGAAIVQTIGPGSPTCAVTVEFLAHLGVRRIVLVGVAGALDATLSTGDVVVVDGAESDEGTSAHYGSHHQPCPTLTGLIGALGSAGSVVTTDAPLRLTQADVDRYRLNAQAIDMELAALFAAGHTVGVSTAGVLVISDRFGEDGWSLGDRGIADDRVADCIDQVLRALEASR